MSNRLLTTEQAIKMLRISRPTLYVWMKKGILKPVDMYPAQFQRRPALYFREEDVRALMPKESISDEDLPPALRPSGRIPA